MPCSVGRCYVVQSGDIPFDIAQRELGDGNRWREILKPNGVQLTESEAVSLQPGQELCIPGQVIVQDSQEDVPPSIIVQVLQLINNERSRANLQPLRLNTALTQAAQRHSTGMAYQDFFNHRGADGSNFASRIKDAGYRFSVAAENIAAGQSTASDAVKAWMNSAGHRDNILNSAYTETGIGYEFLANDSGRVNYKHYWTQTFGRPA